MSKSSENQENNELFNIQVNARQVKEIVALQHEKYSKVELSEMGQAMGAVAFIQGAKALLSVVGKEKAKEAIKKAVYDFAYMGAKAAAKERGNPKDLKSYLEFQHEAMGKFPFIPPARVLEETKTKLHGGVGYCPFANAVRAMAEQLPEYVTPDVLEVVCARCETLDSGRVEGFNPDMKMTRTHFMLGDFVGEPRSDACYFEFETPE